MELKNKVAIVTGSGRGIGKGIAVEFARAGAKVIINGRKLKEAEGTAQEIIAAGGIAMPIAADVIKKAEVDAMVAATLKEYGSVDILVNNAGIEAPPRLLKDIPEDQWDRTLGVNLKGVYICCQAVIPAMMAQGKGKIINIASTAGLRMTFFGSADYTASKYAVTGLTHHLAWELADSRINVNAICPGGVFTPLMAEGTTQEYRDQVSKRLVPLGRFCTIEEIGYTAVFLASDKSDMITGQFLAVDGGVLTGFGEDLRPIVRQRMEEMKAKGHH